MIERPLTKKYLLPKYNPPQKITEILNRKKQSETG